MSQSNGIWSRRQIIKATAALPLVGLARQALAEPTEENQAALTAAARPIPDEELEEILEHAKKEHKADREKFRPLALLLWNYFRLGVDATGRCEVKVPAENRIAYELYKETGEALACSLKQDKFPDHFNDMETNVCAFMAGQKAAELALAHKPWVVSAAIAHKACEEVRNNRRRCFARGAVRKTCDDPPSEVPFIGLGC